MDIKALQKLGDGVLVGVGLLLDQLNKVFQNTSATLVRDNSSREVSEDVWANGLNSIAVVGLIQKQIDDSISALK